MYGPEIIYNYSWNKTMWRKTSHEYRRKDKMGQKLNSKQIFEGGSKELVWKGSGV